MAYGFNFEKEVCSKVINVHALIQKYYTIYFHECVTALNGMRKPIIRLTPSTQSFSIHE